MIRRRCGPDRFVSFRRGEVYAYDQRHRLRGMQRGTLDGDIDDPGVGIADPIDDAEMPAVQNWPMGDSQASPPVEPGLDRRGNWAGFEYETGTAAASQSRTANAANEYESVYTTIGGLIVGQLLEHDAAGNLVEIALVGDLNCDGEVNINDIGAFSLALSDPPAYAAAYPDCNIDLGDINADASVNVGDINAFTALLSAGHPAAARRYTYDEENRLTAVTEWDETPLLEIAYDALGRRVLTKDHLAGCGIGFQPVQTRQVYAGIEVLEEHACCDGEDSGGLPDCATGWALAREFLWGERFPEPLAMIDFTDAGDVPAAGTTGGGAETLHFVHDSLGSVIGLIDAGDPEATPEPIPPKMVERYEYDPYGRTYVEAWDSGTSEWVRLSPVEGASAAASRFGNPFAWTGQRVDAAVGMYHFLFRSYLPELGRWMQRDPSEYPDGLSLYQLTSSKPLLLFDAFGDDGVGHHWVPQSVVEELADAMSEAAKNMFRQEVSGPTTPSHNYGTYGGMTHSEYNNRVRDIAKEFIKNKGISRTKPMSPRQAKQLLKLVLQDTALRGFIKEILEQRAAAAAGAVGGGARRPPGGGGGGGLAKFLNILGWLIALAEPCAADDNPAWNRDREAQFQRLVDEALGEIDEPFPGPLAPDNCDDDFGPDDGYPPPGFPGPPLPPCLMIM